MPTAVEFFLKLDGIQGEITTGDHKGQIPVLSFTFGVGQIIRNEVGGGGGAGKPQLQDLIVVKPMDSSSRGLMLACAQGSHMHKGEFHIVRTNSDGVAAEGDFATYLFSDVTIDGVRQMGNEHAGIPTEEISINFSRLDSFLIGLLRDGSG